MEKIHWSDEFLTHHPVIDDHHRKFFTLTNLLIDALIDGETGQSVEDVIESFLEFTRVHFQDEEKIFEEINHPLLDFQKKEHSFILGRIQNLTSGEHGSRVSKELIHFLHEVYHDHFRLEVDELRPYFQGHLNN